MMGVYLQCFVLLLHKEIQETKGKPVATGIRLKCLEPIDGDRNSLQHCATL